MSIPGLSGTSSVLGRISTDGAARSLFYAAAWTSSFDIFFNIKLGVNLRACQLFVILAMGIFFYANRNIRAFRTHPGFVALWLWILVISAMSLTAKLPQRGIGYAFWAMLSGLMIFIPAQLFTKTQHLESLARIYVYGFGFVAGFGLLQFALGVVGLPAPLVTQWWIPDALPRVNGFSYEPSYFSTYLLLGYPVASLLAANPQLSPGLFSPFKLTRIIIFAAVVLSSSRMGIVFMMAWEGLRALLWLCRGLYQRSARVLVTAALLFASVTGVMIVLVGRYADEFQALDFLLAGLGVDGGSDHSLTEREIGREYTLKVFEQAPLTGVGLGSVAEKIAEMNGVNPRIYEDTKAYEGQAVFVEILAGTGILGFALFISFYLYLCWETYRAAMRRISTFHQLFCYGILASSVLVMILLQLNQNILRPYVWVHFGIMAAFLRYGSRQNERADPQPGALSV